jgi:hypothetical protein
MPEDTSSKQSRHTISWNLLLKLDLHFRNIFIWNWFSCTTQNRITEFLKSSWSTGLPFLLVLSKDNKQGNWLRNYSQLDLSFISCGQNVPFNSRSIYLKKKKTSIIPMENILWTLSCCHLVTVGKQRNCTKPTYCSNGGKVGGGQWGLHRVKNHTHILWP